MSVVVFSIIDGVVVAAIQQFELIRRRGGGARTHGLRLISVGDERTKRSNQSTILLSVTVYTIDFVN